jgi:hypothetical protein
MKLSIAFPMLALSLALIGCDDAKPDWVDADAARQVEDRSVPELVDKAHPPVQAAKTAQAPSDQMPAEDEAEVAGAKSKAKKAIDDAEVSSGDAAEPEVDVDAKLFVKRLVIAKGVEAREPVSPASTFTQGESDRIYAFVEVGNEDKAASAISVSFFRDGESDRGGVELRVGESPRWRTWAFTRLAKKPGKWHVVVRGPKGQELARDSFEVVAADKPQASADDAAEKTEDGARG